MLKPSLLGIVEQRVALRKSGKEYLGCCPFHNEKTPSFAVNEEKGLFHCFGCGAGGDVFTFVMRMDGLTFAEAKKELGTDDYNPPRPAVSREAAAIAEWCNGAFERVQAALRDIGRQIRIAGELNWREQIDRLEEEWAILSDLSDDLQNAAFALELYGRRETIENVIELSSGGEA